MDYDSCTCGCCMGEMEFATKENPYCNCAEYAEDERCDCNFCLEEPNRLGLLGGIDV